MVFVFLSHFDKNLLSNLLKILKRTPPIRKATIRPEMMNIVIFPILSPTQYFSRQYMAREN